MAAPQALVVLVATFLLAASSRASKYSREANEGLAAAEAKRRETGEFRVVRLNQVWEKAQRVSGVRGGTRGVGGGRGRPRRLERGGAAEEENPGPPGKKSWPCFARPPAWGQASGCRGLSPGFRPGWWLYHLYFVYTKSHAGGPATGCHCYQVRALTMTV